MQSKKSKIFRNRFQTFPIKIKTIVLFFFLHYGFSFLLKTYLNFLNGRGVINVPLALATNSSPTNAFPTKLADIHATLDDMDAVITKALSGIDVRKWPYEVTPDMILDAVKEIEKYND